MTSGAGRAGVRRSGPCGAGWKISGAARVVPRSPPRPRPTREVVQNLAHRPGRDRDRLPPRTGTHVITVPQNIFDEHSGPAPGTQVVGDGFADRLAVGDEPGDVAEQDIAAVDDEFVEHRPHRAGRHLADPIGQDPDAGLDPLGVGGVVEAHSQQRGVSGWVRCRTGCGSNSPSSLVIWLRRCSLIGQVAPSAARVAWCRR